MNHLARRTDPQTSHDAAAASRHSRNSQASLVLGLLMANPDSTYQELFARHVEIQRLRGDDPVIRDAPSLMRRLGEVAHKSGERKCRITGKRASVWTVLEVPQ